EEMIRRGVRTGDVPGAQTGRWNLVLDHLETGSLPAATDVLFQFRREALRSGRTVDRWWWGLISAAISTAQGRFADGEELAEQALALGMRLCPDDALLFYAIQLFVARWRQGQLGGLRTSIEEMVRRDPPVPGAEAALAVLLVETGERAEAAGVVRGATRPEALERLPRNRTWIGIVALLAHAASACAADPQPATGGGGDVGEGAARLRILLGPWEG